MALTEDIVGKYVVLKSAGVEDAEFTLNIRRDPEFVKYLPEIKNTLEEQKTWIKKQRVLKGDYFFVVWDKKGKRVGTVSIFDLDKEVKKAGRLALKGNALQNIEAQYLIFKFAFCQLGIDKLWGFVYVENERAIRFTKLFGTRVYDEKQGEDDKLIREVEHYHDDFIASQENIERMIYRKQENIRRKSL